jgi:hypothetical protein
MRVAVGTAVSVGGAGVKVFVLVGVSVAVPGESLQGPGPI